MISLLRYGLVIAIFQALVACGPSAVDTPKAAGGETAVSENGQESTRRVIAFGDSLYAGYNLGPQDGFVPQLQAALRAKGHAVTVQNAGVSGDTTAAGKARLTFVLDNAGQDVELVILGLGGNDMLRGIRPEETRANLKAMLDELKKRKIDVVLTGMLAAPNLGADYAGKFNGIYPDLAKEYGVPLYPFFLDGVVTDKSLMLRDNIHPNAKGVAKMVEKITPTIEAALKSNE